MPHSEKWIHSRLRVCFAVLLSAVLVSTIGCSDDETSSDFRFSPKNVQLNTGDTVRWIGVSGDHTVTSGEGSADPDDGDLFDADLAAGDTFSHVFNAVGTYDYFCRPHESEGMTGTAIVSAPTATRVNVSAAGVDFSPANIQIHVGDTVRWTASGVHTITSGTGPADPTVGNLFDTNLPSGQNFSFVFNAAGVFPYFCQLHFADGMTGTVTVTAAVKKTVEVEALD